VDTMVERREDFTTVNLLALSNAKPFVTYFHLLCLRLLRHLPRSAIRHRTATLPPAVTQPVVLYRPKTAMRSVTKRLVEERVARKVERREDSTTVVTTVVPTLVAITVAKKEEKREGIMGSSSKHARSTVNPRAILLRIVTCMEEPQVNAATHHPAIRLRIATVVHQPVTIAAIHHPLLVIPILIVTCTLAPPAAPTQNATPSAIMLLEARKEERKEVTTVDSTTVLPC